MSTVSAHAFETSLGVIRVASTKTGLALISLPGESDRSFDNRVRRLAKGTEVVNDGTPFREVNRQIAEYLDGQRKEFTVPLDVRGTAFQLSVLSRVSAIPYGRTRTYGEIANEIGRPGASRAVGMANAKNCLPLIIPCHRVVAADGLGGYGGGIELKRKLLELEGAL
ncbi:MAG: methylated-DNA--[protein]-cysteine S-methyltransferase [Candidatus Zixiibacteriota bacterium]